MRTLQRQLLTLARQGKRLAITGLLLLGILFGGSKAALADPPGNTNQFGFLDTGGVFTTLNYPGPAASYTAAFGINDSGQIVGIVYTPEPSSWVLMFSLIVGLGARSLCRPVDSETGGQK